MKPDISVIICTYNRADMLRDTLGSFFSMDLDGGPTFEVIVVDNRSTDTTSEVAAKFAHQNPDHICVIREPKQGLSHARNTGIREARGDIVAFVDDDVFFDSGWLKGVASIFRDYPEASCLGGKSIPQFEGGRPDWVTDELLIMYGSTNSGNKIKEMVYPEHPFGLNMAFRREVFDTIGNFGIHLGRKKNNLLSSEESDLFFRINNAGLKIVYTPNALLYHRIPATRARKNWIISRYYWQGISDIAFHQALEPSSRVHLLQNIFRDTLELIVSLTGGYCSPRKAYWHFKTIHLRERIHQAFLRGQIRQMIREALGSRK